MQAGLNLRLAAAQSFRLLFQKTCCRERLLKKGAAGFGLRQRRPLIKLQKTFPCQPLIRHVRKSFLS
ncbi:hypothetical protein A0O21_03620 [Streptococcus pantholopis]|uniref:Uncharacterized protein n=1 Tax=Streptococcus pantholopis TaxID=1811193 RepID=A0A172Q6T9_9STRE|nr:hypothetical protein A0O21_03620 [Streptococcus pantholopis]